MVDRAGEQLDRANSDCCTAIHSDVYPIGRGLNEILKLNKRQENFHEFTRNYLEIVQVVPSM